MTRRDELIELFNRAVESLPEIAKRVEAGQQFNEWDRASNDEMDDPDDMSFLIGIGPISDLFTFEEIEGERKADLFVSALKLAAYVSKER